MNTLTIRSSRRTLLAQLRGNDAILLPGAFSLELASHLAVEAAELDYVVQKEYAGPRQVRQQVASTSAPLTGALAEFCQGVEADLRQFFGEGVFEQALHFTEHKIQRYEDGSHGIDPHRDHSINLNLIVLCGLQGSGRFTVYEDLGGPATLHLTTTPGDVLLLASPGFLGRSICPVHGVDQIKGKRYLLALRQEKGGS